MKYSIIVSRMKNAFNKHSIFLFFIRQNKDQKKKRKKLRVSYQFLFIRFTIFPISSINLLILVGVFEKATSVIRTSVYNRSMDSHGFWNDKTVYSERISLISTVVDLF